MSQASYPSSRTLEPFSFLGGETRPLSPHPLYPTFPASEDLRDVSMSSVQSEQLAVVATPSSASRQATDLFLPCAWSWLEWNQSRTIESETFATWVRTACRRGGTLARHWMNGAMASLLCALFCFEDDDVIEPTLRDS